MDIKARIQKLSKREQTIAALTLVLTIVLLPYMLLYSPSEKQLRLKQKKLAELNEEIKAISTALSLAAAKQEAVPEPVAPPSPTEDLSEVFKSISREASLLGVDFISIVPEDIEYKKDFVQMQLRLQLRARYRQLYDFIRQLNTRHRLFLIQSIRFEVNVAVYPSGIALIKATAYLKRK
jgi:type II secretory pathway component PulM